MPRRGLVHFDAGGFNARLQGADLRTAVSGCVDQVLQAFGQGGTPLQARRIERGQRVGRSADECLERAPGEVNVLARLDFLGQDGVEPGLGLVHVGACTGPRQQGLLGRVQTGRGADFLGFDQGQLVRRQQGVEIGRAQAHARILDFQVQPEAGVVHEESGLGHVQLCGRRKIVCRRLSVPLVLT
jgi:hypothetical protein